MQSIDKDTLFIMIEEMLVNKFEIEKSQIHTQAHFQDDLDLDSIDLLDMIAEINKKYKLSLSALEFKNVRTIEQAIDVVYNKLNT